jgi:hypothetical protein
MHGRAKQTNIAAEQKVLAPLPNPSLRYITSQHAGQSECPAAGEESDQGELSAAAAMRAAQKAARTEAAGLEHCTPWSNGTRGRQNAFFGGGQARCNYQTSPFMIGSSMDGEAVFGGPA